MQRALIELRTALSKGIYEGLRFLNHRTPHRFTGIYRFDEEVLRSIHLFDRFDPSVQVGDDVDMRDAYCALLGQRKGAVVFNDIRTTGDVPVRSRSSVISYCGVLMADAAGRLYGSLCHFDTKPCEQRKSDIPLLEAAVPLFLALLPPFEGRPFPDPACR